jgi:hypothetical protein
MSPAVACQVPAQLLLLLLLLGQEAALLGLLVQSVPH